MPSSSHDTGHPGAGQEKKRKVGFVKSCKRKIRKAQSLARLSGEYLSDLLRYNTYSSSAGLHDQDQISSKIIALFHNIEKGLSLPAPRLGFGKDNIRTLIFVLNRPGVDLTRHPASTAIDVLAAYVAFNEKNGKSDYPHKAAIAKLIAVRASEKEEPAGGLRSVSKEQIRRIVANVSDDFFLERHSIRQFSGEPVDLDLVRQAIGLAQKAPAVCNRQLGHVHIVRDAAKKEELLQFQGGSRGFSDQLDLVLVVTTKLSNFWGPGERNQMWVDGGLYAMALIYALHAKGLGSVCLNWSRSAQDSRKLRRMLDMEEDQATIMMIGVGNLREEFQVPISRRRDPALSYRLI